MKFAAAIIATATAVHGATLGSRQATTDQGPFELLVTAIDDKNQAASYISATKPSGAAPDSTSRVWSLKPWQPANRAQFFFDTATGQLRATGTDKGATYNQFSSFRPGSATAAGLWPLTWSNSNDTTLTATNQFSFDADSAELSMWGDRNFWACFATLPTGEATDNLQIYHTQNNNPTAPDSCWRIRIVRK